MHSQIVRRDYSKQKEFQYFFCSDFHIGSPHFNKKKLIKDLDRAKRIGALIGIIGDVGEMIVPHDPRHSGASSPYNSDSIINKTIQDQFEILKPYAENIMFIGTGNHETKFQKYSGFDPIQELVMKLNRECGTEIQHGQYAGFLQIRYHHGNNGSVKNYTVSYNHGKGRGTESQLKNALFCFDCDMFLQGHGHFFLIVPLRPQAKVDLNGNIYYSQKHAISLGGYADNSKQYNATDDGYNLNYGEEKVSYAQSQGGIFVKHTITNNGIKTSLTIEE